MTAGEAIVFIGPSLPDFSSNFPTRFQQRPPVAQGDIYLAAAENPRAIGIVDGYFHGAPAVWHKEILWALSCGIHVFGASSMGALRAAELHQFGMCGVGRIFEAFRDGILNDDDEVALIHGPQDLGFPNLSEPMVNIRASLDHAVSENVISNEIRERILCLAKGQFYQTRTWDGIFEATAENKIPQEPIENLKAWIPVNSVDQKRRDAVELVSAMDRFLKTDPPPFRAEFAFEWTEMWANAPWLNTRPDAINEAQSENEEEVIDELRLLGPFYFEILEKAVLRAYAENDIVDAETAPTRKDVLAQIDSFRRSHDLTQRQRFQDWLASSGTNSDKFEKTMITESHVRSVARLNAGRLQHRILDQLKLSGDYERLLHRAKDKADQLNNNTRHTGQLHSLAESHFGRLDSFPPSDFYAYAADLGLDDIGQFLQLLRKEAIYLKMNKRGADEE